MRCWAQETSTDLWRRLMDDIEDFLDHQSRTLVRPLDQLRMLGDDIGSCPEAEALERLRAVYRFCTETLLPLLEAHQTLLDPAVQGLSGGLEVDHALGAERLRLRGFIATLGRRLEEGCFDAQARSALRRELYLLARGGRCLPRPLARPLPAAVADPAGRRVRAGPGGAAQARLPGLPALPPLRDAPVRLTRWACRRPGRAATRGRAAIAVALSAPGPRLGFWAGGRGQRTEEKRS